MSDDTRELYLADVATWQASAATAQATLIAAVQAALVTAEQTSRTLQASSAALIVRAYALGLASPNNQPSIESGFLKTSVEMFLESRGKMFDYMRAWRLANPATPIASPYP